MHPPSSRFTGFLLLNSGIAILLLAALAIFAPNLRAASSTSELSDAAMEDPELKDHLGQFNSFLWQEYNYESARQHADAILAIGESLDNDSIRVRGLIRLVFIELLFGKWRNEWEEKLERCEKLLNRDGSIAHAEYLIFTANMKAKWLDDIDEAVERLEQAIKLGNELADDEFLVHCHTMGTEIYGFQKNMHGVLNCAYMGLIISEELESKWCRCAALHQFVSSIYHVGQQEQARKEILELRDLWPNSQTVKLAVISIGEGEELLDSLLAKVREEEKKPQSLTTSDVIGKTYWSLAHTHYQRGNRQVALELINKAIPHLEYCRNVSILELANFRKALIELTADTVEPEELERIVRLVDSKKFKLSIPSEALTIANSFWKLGNAEKAKNWQRTAVEFARGEKSHSWKFIEMAAKKNREAELRSRQQKQKNREQVYRATAAYSTLAILGLATMLTLAIGITRQRVISKQKKELEHLVDQRTQSLSLAMEKSRSADKAKSEFLARMNHEIRNPLTAILGFIELLRSLPFDKATEREQCFDGLQASSTHLHELVNDILEVARVEREEIDFHSRSFEVSHTVRSVQDILAGKANKKSLEFIVDIDIASGLTLIGDESKLRQILLNLVGNAIKFTNEGTVHLGIATKPSENESDTIEVNIQVSDTGCGIPASEQDMIFDRFTFASSNDHKFGSGLGLYITKLLVLKLDGKIELESQVGDGTVVKVNLPFLMDPGPSESIELERNQQVPKNIQILVVDDQQPVCDSLCARLKMMGYETRATNLPENALDLVVQWKPDLVLLDLRMPRLSGFEVFAQILESNERPIVIAMTGDATTETKATCQRLGFDNFLIKPFNMNDLQNVLPKTQDLVGQNRLQEKR